MEKEVIDEATKLLPEVYKDLAQPTAKEIGIVAGRSIKALLSPIRGLLWGFEKIEQVVSDGVEKRFEKIPEEKRKTPEPEIAVPLMQALTYTAQNETLREMYLNLLANSMNTDKEKDVHPSFVELIKQMSSLDAKVFAKLSSEKGYQKIINPKIAILETNQVFIDATPEWFIGWTIEEHDIFDVSSSLVRLGKFGLIELMFDRTAGKDSYQHLKENKELINILDKYKQAKPQEQLEIRANESIVYVNEYGKQFKNACVVEI